MDRGSWSRRLPIDLNQPHYLIEFDPRNGTIPEKLGVRGAGTSTAGYTYPAHQNTRTTAVITTTNNGTNIVKSVSFGIASFPLKAFVHVR